MHRKILFSSSSPAENMPVRVVDVVEVSFEGFNSETALASASMNGWRKASSTKQPPANLQTNVMLNT